MNNPYPEKDCKGRGTSLTSAKFERIVSLVKAGNYLETSARAAGVPIRTLHNWLSRGRKAAEAIESGIELHKDEDLYINFYNAVEVAKGEAEATNVLLIQKEAQKTWTAAAWMLERQYPDRWGRKERIDSNITGNVNVSYADAVQEAWKKRREQIDKEQEDNGADC